MSKEKTTKPLSNAERKRLHVAAMVTQEKEWPQSEPNQGLARMFVIMLLVHVVVIGGVIVYDFVSEPADARIASSTKKVTSGSTTSTAAKTSAPLPVVKDAPESAAAVLAGVTTPPVIENPAPASTPTPVPAPAMAPAKINESVLPEPRRLAPEPQKPMLTSPVSAPPAALPLPEPRSQKAEVQSEPPAPVVAPRATIVTETSEKAKSSSTSHPKASEPATEVKRTESSPPHPVPSPSAARRDMEKEKDNDSKRSAPPAAAPAKKHVESEPPATAKKHTPEPESAPKKAVKPAATVAGQHHTVAKGETIYAIARKYKVSEDALMKANGIKNASSLQVGKALVIPAK